MKRTGELLFLVLAWLGGASGCATMDAQVRERAAEDFSCRRDQLRIVDAEATVFRVAGCGSIATYRCKESPIAMQCRRASWDQPDSEYVSTAAGSYTLKRRSLAEAEQLDNARPKR